MANYLYNGVELPPLPENEHLYVYFTNKRSMLGVAVHHAYFTPEPYYAYSDSGGYCIGYRAGAYQYNVYPENSGAVEWRYQTECQSDGLWGSLGSIAWSNFDIVDENGNVVLPASYPIDAETGEAITIYGLNGYREVPPIPPIPTAIMLGFQTGTATRLMRKHREPVAYLYGADKVRLPEIPSEVTAYPYVVLQRSTLESGTFYAYGYDVKPYTEFYEPPVIGDPHDRLRIDSGTYVSGALYKDRPNEWFVSDTGNVADHSQGVHLYNFKHIVWANFDIYASDGTLYMPKTDPEPVYE